MVPPRGQRFLMRFLNALLPAALFAALVAAWWAAVEIAKVPSYLLPPPQDVLPRIVSDRESFIAHSWVTVQEILLGFALSAITAIPLGLLIALSPLSKRMLYPLLVFIQLVPKIAIAPLFVVWLGFGACDDRAHSAA